MSKFKKREKVQQVSIVKDKSSPQKTNLQLYFLFGTFFQAHKSIKELLKGIFSSLWQKKIIHSCFLKQCHSFWRRESIFHIGILTKGIENSGMANIDVATESSFSLWWQSLC